ncbi:MAG: metallophosphoesterase family protein [Candidatus Woesearchaeota archaeon]
MKYLILSDYHGNCNNLESVIQRESPKVVISLGDFDTTECINKYHKLIEKYKLENIEVYGNHDYAVYTKQNIYSGTLNKIGTSISELVNDYKEDDTSTKNLNKLIENEGQIKTFKIEDKNVISVHGGLSGNLKSYSNCPSRIKKVWYRMKSRTDYKRNFKEMENKGYEIMIRGHDHKRDFIYINNDDLLMSKIPRNNDSFNLNQKYMIINPGDFFSGNYATIEKNKDNLILTYHSIK